MTHLLTKLGFSLKPLLLLKDSPELLSYGKHKLRFSGFLGSAVLVHHYGLKQEPVELFSVVTAADSAHVC